MPLSWMHQLNASTSISRSKFLYYAAALDQGPRLILPSIIQKLSEFFSFFGLLLSVYPLPEYWGISCRFWICVDEKGLALTLNCCSCDSLNISECRAFFAGREFSSWCLMRIEPFDISIWLSSRPSVLRKRLGKPVRTCSPSTSSSERASKTSILTLLWGLAANYVIGLQHMLLHSARAEWPLPKIVLRGAL